MKSRKDVVGRTSRHVRVVVTRQPGQPKVGQLRIEVVRQQNVAGLDVTVYALRLALLRTRKDESNSTPGCSLVKGFPVL